MGRSWRIGAAKADVGTALDGQDFEAVDAAQDGRGIGPRATAQDFEAACGGALGVSFWAGGVVVFGVPVGTPLPDIAGQIERAVRTAAQGEGTNRGQTGVAVDGAPVVGAVGGEVAPGPEPAVGAAGALFPFGLGGEAAAAPVAVGVGIAQLT